VLQPEISIRELLAVDALASGAIAAREVARATRTMLYEYVLQSSRAELYSLWGTIYKMDVIRHVQVKVFPTIVRLAG
jgi:hypothetical protein